MNQTGGVNNGPVFDRQQRNRGTGGVFQPAATAVAQYDSNVLRLVRPEVEEAEMSTLQARKEWIEI